MMCAASNLECLQVQHLVAFIVGLVGELIIEIGGMLTSFGGTVKTYGACADVMQSLTTGIFGTNDGLIYWINDKIFYLIREMPWCELGAGLGALLQGLQTPACP